MTYKIILLKESRFYAMIHVLCIYVSKKCMFDADTKLNIELKHDSPEKFRRAPSDLLIKLKEGSQ